MERLQSDAPSSLTEAPLSEISMQTAQIVCSREEDPSQRKERKNFTQAPLFFILRSSLSAYSWRVFFLLLALCAAALTTLALPLALRFVIDSEFSGKFSSGREGLIFLSLGGLALALALSSAARAYLVGWISGRLEADLRTALFQHLLYLDLAFFDRTTSGALTTCLTTDTLQIKESFGTSLPLALRNFLLCGGGVVMMGVTSIRLSCLVLLTIPLILLLVLGIARRLRGQGRLVQEQLGQLSGFSNEMVGAVRSLRAYGAQNYVIGRFKTRSEAQFEAARKAMVTRSLLSGAAIALVSASVIFVVWVGAKDVRAGQLTPGLLSQFVLYAFLAATSLGALSQLLGEMATALGAADRINALLETPSSEKAFPYCAQKKTTHTPVGEKKVPALPRRVQGAVSFQSVCFSYPLSPHQRVLNKLSFSIQAGERVALVGPSGAGKSTIFQLLMCFYPLESGRILLDGLEISTFPAEEIRKRIALVPQDPALFSDSLLNNIRYGAPQASETEIRVAAKLARVDTFASKIPDGYETLLGERGTTLSGGQRQRLAIARAVLKGAGLLLLDEATNALDALSAHAVQTALDEVMKGRTTLMIAHRLSTALKADRILVLDQGRLVEEGSHTTLVKAGGLYSHLAQLELQKDYEPCTELSRERFSQAEESAIHP